ncbi:ABC-type transport auxiliary lipoprotein family protein [uncultured Sulfitobacter sp.]|uniref:ABC-type transport auxiliary lipoprotein family protein n=1 Tax=uncultured Sulfitobacter sp. TaxID=191468 RepID=UPI00260FA650|nr:ABC-type transport auxiliary lipoprotein family protein [uncultured Sulfitobacter sp.]
MPDLTRRMALTGAFLSLSGCSAITSLNAAAKPLNTYDLRPVTGAKRGGKSSRTLLVALPQATAALATDRIMIKPDAAAITYLPNARWSDELPAVIQSLLIRSVSATGRVAYVGAVGAGPVPDKALLVRIDAFDVTVLPDGTFEATADFDLTLINDRDQRIVASRRFSQSASVESDTPEAIVSAFQGLLDDLLPLMTDWTTQRT